MTHLLNPGDVVRFRWGLRSGRWQVLRTDHPSWPTAIRVRCVTAPRGAKHKWRVGTEGWVIAKMEPVR